MYWYISFLRPPPIAAQAGGSVKVTPQVANDLRTELRYEPTEISYLWQRVFPVFAEPLKAETLTTFIPPASTYKPIDVALPTSAQPGERWRIGLFDPSSASGAASSSLMTTNLVDCTSATPSVLSVWSEGIEIARPQSSSVGTVRGVGSEGQGKKESSSSKGKVRGKEKDEGPKQGRITREWGLPGGGSMEIVEQTSFDLDKKIWDSGLALSSWLCRYLHQPAEQFSPCDALAKPVLEILGRGMGSLDVVELGSGTGLVSIVLALVLQQQAIRSAQTRITATDLESAISLMEENISLNGLDAAEGDADGANNDAGKVSLSLRAKVLDWERPLPSWVSSAEGESTWPDLIIAADVTYNTASFPALLHTLSALMNPPYLPAGKKRPLLLLAYKQRDLGEKDLWTMLEKQGIGLKLVDEVRGAEEEGKVEIWIGEYGIITESSRDMH